jgi:hypothetical protein
MMKTIAQHVADGIATLPELKNALQLAVQLEFSTIPPYLCAQWSIKEDPDRVERILHHIVGQEMSHMALAGNLLSALGGVPRVAHRSFIPKYPTDYLPGGIKQKRPLDLRPLSFEQLEVFMQIENPEFSLVEHASSEQPTTIGEFYDEIIVGFTRVKPAIVRHANTVPVVLYRPIRTVDDAVSVVTRIKVEGEGLQDSPHEPNYDGTAYAHYYLFKEAYRQRRLKRSRDGWEFSGEQIVFPDTHDFSKHDRRHPLQRNFRKVLTHLLVELEGCWRGRTQFGVATMFQLHILGQSLVRRGIKPDFRILEPDERDECAGANADERFFDWF